MNISRSRWRRWVCRARSIPQLAGVFVTTRILDNLKPPPATQAGQAPGGVGVVLDDVVCNLYSLAIGWAMYALITRRRARGARPSVKDEPS